MNDLPWYAVNDVGLHLLAQPFGNVSRLWREHGHWWTEPSNLRNKHIWRYFSTLEKKNMWLTKTKVLRRLTKNQKLRTIVFCWWLFTMKQILHVCLVYLGVKFIGPSMHCQTDDMSVIYNAPKATLAKSWKNNVKVYSYMPVDLETSSHDFMVIHTYQKK